MKSSDFRSAYWVIFMLFCDLRIFSKSTFSKDSFRNILFVSNTWDPGQIHCFVGPDLVPNCLQKLSADNTEENQAP